jgi:hypothetical protein
MHTSVVQRGVSLEGMRQSEGADCVAVKATVSLVAAWPTRTRGCRAAGEERWKQVLLQDVEDEARTWLGGWRRARARQPSSLLDLDRRCNSRRKGGKEEKSEGEMERREGVG